MSEKELYKQLIAIIKEEIKWCEKNKEDLSDNPSYAKPFIGGLKQAIFLIKQHKDRI